MKKVLDPLAEILISPALNLAHEHNGKAIACVLMQNIMYDNGSVDRWNPEAYPIDAVNKIAPIARAFFLANPELLTVEVLDEIASGFHEDLEARFGSLTGYRELNNILNEWFDGEL